MNHENEYNLLVDVFSFFDICPQSFHWLIYYNLKENQRYFCLNKSCQNKNRFLERLR